MVGVKRVYLCMVDKIGVSFNFLHDTIVHFLDSVHVWNAVIFDDEVGFD